MVAFKAQTAKLSDTRKNTLNREISSQIVTLSNCRVQVERVESSLADNEIVMIGNGGQRLFDKIV